MTETPHPSVNPWVALRPGDDVAAHALQVSSAHRSFLDAKDAASTVRSVVRDSWLRSVARGINPNMVDQPGLITGADLEGIRWR